MCLSGLIRVVAGVYIGENSNTVTANIRWKGRGKERGCWSYRVVWLAWRVEELEQWPAATVFLEVSGRRGRVWVGKRERRKESYKTAPRTF